MAAIVQRSESELRPQDLIASLTDELNCTFEHARSLIFQALDQGILTLSPSYTLLRADPLRTEK